MIPIAALEQTACELMAKAAIAVAHRAKPAVQARATYAINHVGLDGLVPFLEAPDVS